MNTNYGDFKRRVESIAANNVANTRVKELMSVRAVFNGLHMLIEKLPQPERDKMLVVLAQDLQELGLYFSSAVTMMLPDMRATERSDDLVEEWGRSVDQDFGIASIM